LSLLADRAPADGRAPALARGFAALRLVDFRAFAFLAAGFLAGGILSS
jgi:hypothetical protein